MAMRRAILAAGFAAAAVVGAPKPEALKKICPVSGWDESKRLDVFDNALNEFSVGVGADKVYQYRRERSYV